MQCSGKRVIEAGPLVRHRAPGLILVVLKKRLLTQAGSVGGGCHQNPTVARDLSRTHLLFRGNAFFWTVKSNVAFNPWKGSFRRCC